MRLLPLAPPQPGMMIESGYSFSDPLPPLPPASDKDELLTKQAQEIRLWRIGGAA